MYKMTCPDCGVALGDDGEAAADTCASCGWSSQGTVSRPSLAVATEAPPRRRKKKRSRQDTAPFDWRGGIMPFAIGAASVLLLWGVLTLLFFAGKRSAAGWLIASGVLSTVVGWAWLYGTAMREGAQRMHFLNVSSPVVTGKVVLLAIEIIAAPIYSIVILLYYFDVAWKPFVIEALGVAMVVSGAMLISR
jgi:hypothetical protein